MDTIFVKRYVAKGELPKVNGWYTIKLSNSDSISIEQLRFDIVRKKFHDDDSEFNHIEYWLEEVPVSELDKIKTQTTKTIEDFQEESSKKYGYKSYASATNMADTDTYGRINFEAEEAFSAHRAVQRVENKKPSHANRNYEEVDSEKLAQDYLERLRISSASLDPKRDKDRYAGFIAGINSLQSRVGGFSLEHIHYAINMARGITIKGDGTHFFHSTNLEIVDYLKFLPQSASLITKETGEELTRSADEREVLVQAFDKITKEFEGRDWIMEGRGCYPYNDDRYKQEVRYIFDAFTKIKKEVWANIKSKSFEYRDRIKAEALSQLSEKWNDDNTKDELVKFGKWYQLDESQREHKQLWTSIVDRYLIKRGRDHNYLNKG
jgi:hypothetical protein